MTCCKGDRMIETDGRLIKVSDHWVAVSEAVEVLLMIVLPQDHSSSLMKFQELREKCLFATSITLS